MDARSSVARWPRRASRPVGLVLLLSASSTLAQNGDGASTSTGTDDLAIRRFLPSIPKARVRVSNADLDSTSGSFGTEDELLTLLEARGRYLRKGDRVNADVELTNIIELGKSLRIRNFPLVSAAFMHEARAALTDPGSIPVSALVAAKAACQLSPDLADAHFLRARLLMTYSVREIPSAIGSALDGVRALFSAIRNRVALISTLAGVILSTLLATFLIYALVELFRNLRFMGHDLVRPLPEWVSDFQGALFLLLALVAPFVLGFGIVPTLVVILVVLIPYQSKKEQIVSAVSAALLAMFPLAVDRVAPLLSFFGSTTDSLLMAADEGFSDEAESNLIELSKAGRADYDVAVVLGLRARRRGDLAAAESWYRAAIQANSGSVLAKNNLAKLLYARREQDEAKKLLEAAKASRIHAEPYLNLATLELEMSKFEAANKLIESARSIDPVVTRHYNDLSPGGSTAERLLEIPFEETSLWPRVVAGDPARNARISAQVWTFVGGRTPADVFPVATLALVGLAFALGQKRKQLNLSAPCMKCGRPANPFVAKQLCDQCRTIFLKAVAVDPSMRERKEKRIRFYQRRLRWTERILSILPGAGDVFGGRTLTGVTFLFFFVLGLASITWINRMSFHPWSVGPVQVAAPIVAAVALVEVILALVCARRSFRG
ncbi:MAG: hypothetical protein HYV07_14575 [Deltaproteobacteria bacterium]|nr:hypothetical protein [Deltaproteobacteria bacterium]